MTVKIIVQGEPQDNINVVADAVRDALTGQGAQVEFVGFNGSVASLDQRQRAMRGRRMFLATQQVAPPGSMAKERLADPQQPFGAGVGQTYDPTMPSASQFDNFRVDGTVTGRVPPTDEK